MSYNNNNIGVMPFECGFDIAKLTDIKFSRSQVDANGMMQKKQVML